MYAMNGQSLATAVILSLFIYQLANNLIDLRLFSKIGFTAHVKKITSLSKPCVSVALPKLCFEGIKSILISRF